MRPRPSDSAQIANEIEGVEENVRDGQGALDEGSLLALHLWWIVSSERFPSERPGDGPQRHIRQPKLRSNDRQWKGMMHARP